MTTKLNLIFLAGAIAGLLGCGGGTVMTDAGGTDSGPGNDAGTDAGPISSDVHTTIHYVDPDTGMVMELPAPAAHIDMSGTFMPTTMDTSCVNMMRTPPESGTMDTITATVKDFQTSDPVPMVVTQFYAHDGIPFDHSCSATDPMFPCNMNTSDAMGHVSGLMDFHNSWYAFYVGAHMGADMAHTAVPTAEFNEPADTTVTFNSVSAQTLAIIPTVLGLRRQAGTAIIAGTVYDCMDHPVQGAVIRVFRADGSLVAEPPDGTPGSATMPAYRYFNGMSFPSATQPYTNVDGLYAAANMPAPTDAFVRIEAWVNVGGVHKMWGCEKINVFADGTTIINVRPYRSDGPMGCTEMTTSL